MLVTLILAALRFNSFQVGVHYDDANYIVLAESIARGAGYRLINYPDIRGGGYPGGWPLLLAPVVAAFPGDYAPLKLVSLAFWLGTIPLVYAFFRKHFGSPWCELGMLLVAVNPLTVGAADWVMSESAYTFFSVASIVAFERWRDRSFPIRSRALPVIIFITTFALLIRTVGMTLLAAELVVLLIHKRFKALLFVGLVTSASLGLQAWINHEYARGDGVVTVAYERMAIGCGSTERACDVLAKAGHGWVNLQGYANTVLANSVLPIFSPNVEAAAGGALAVVNAVVVAVLTFGYLLSIRRLRVSEIYVAGYTVALLSYWEATPEMSVLPRYLIPVIPMLYAYVFEAGLRSAARAPRIPRTLLKMGLLAAAACICIVGVARDVQDWRAPIRDRLPDLAARGDWLREHAAANAVIMTKDAVPVYLYARRQTVDYPEDEATLQGRIAQDHVAYIVSAPGLLETSRDEWPSDAVAEALAAAPDRYRLVFTNVLQKVRIYQVV